MSTDVHPALVNKFGGKWLIEGAPDDEIPERPMTPLAAKRLVAEEMVLDGIPERNLATFVTRPHGAMPRSPARTYRGSSSDRSACSIAARRCSIRSS